MYDLQFTDKAKREFLKLDKSVQERIGSVLERIRTRPEHFVERLVDRGGYKLRIGDYRAILEIDKTKLLISVLKIGHRKNIYDRF